MKFTMNEYRIKIIEVILCLSFVVEIVLDDE